MEWQWKESWEKEHLKRIIQISLKEQIAVVWDGVQLQHIEAKKEEYLDSQKTVLTIYYYLLNVYTVLSMITKNKNPRLMSKDTRNMHDK